jgi:hypothetical protein
LKLYRRTEVPTINGDYNSNGHMFGETMKCVHCTIPYKLHQKNPEPCPVVLNMAMEKIRSMERRYHKYFSPLGLQDLLNSQMEKLQRDEKEVKAVLQNLHGLLEP